MATEPLLADIESEGALVVAIFLRADRELLGKVDVKDFVDPFNCWFVCELKLMCEAGFPLGEIGILKTWLTGDTSAQRLRKVLKGTSIQDAILIFVDLCSKFRYGCNEIDFYLKSIRNARARRWLLKFSDDVKEKITLDPNNVIRTVEWAIRSLEVVHDKLAEDISHERKMVQDQEASPPREVDRAATQGV